MAESEVNGTDVRHLPTHVGIIMDGNGRWAERRGLRRSEGHKEGLEAAKRVVHAAARAGVPYLSLYTFSTENWSRAEAEVSFLMFLLKHHLKREYDFYRQNRVRVVHSGDIDGLPAEVQREVFDVVRDTAHYDRLTVNLAINYGGRDEIVRAVNRWLTEGRRHNGDGITNNDISRYLDHPEIPEPDMIIRTAGERRLSNFLLWQSHYAELVFSDVCWPDWSAEHFDAAVAEYARRTRKFGGTA